MELQASVRRMMTAGGLEEPAAKHPLPQVKLRPSARQQALAILATRAAHCLCLWARPSNGALLPGAGLTWMTRQVVLTIKRTAHMVSRIPISTATLVQASIPLPQRQSQRPASAQQRGRHEGGCKAGSAGVCACRHRQVQEQPAAGAEAAAAETVNGLLPLRRL